MHKQCLLSARTSIRRTVGLRVFGWSVRNQVEGSRGGGGDGALAALGGARRSMSAAAGRGRSARSLPSRLVLRHSAVSRRRSFAAATRTPEVSLFRGRSVRPRASSSSSPSSRRKCVRDRERRRRGDVSQHGAEHATARRHRRR
jgi:hypothetical protein